MYKRISVGLSAAGLLRFVIAFLLLTLTGRTFTASAQTLTVLYSFSGGTNGAYLQAGLVQGSDGNFYGTIMYGGTHGLGAVFRMSPSGTYTTLYSFVGSPIDGCCPQAGLVQGSDGNFYGTSYAGGTSNLGAVFRISPGGSETDLYSFGFPPDGFNPQAGLMQGSDGNFYGTTKGGGANNTGTNGTVFRISPSGIETVLYRFGSIPNDGFNPQAVLVQDSGGNFYGTTPNGGTNGYGTVFRISLSGTETTLYSFGNFPTDGAEPYAGLVQGSDGDFYGTTWGGGTYTSGTIFQLIVPLNPPANQISAAQVTGSNVTFSISSVARETYQLQFSSSMNPTNWVNIDGVSVTNSIGALLTVTNFGGAVGPQGFYRFAITP